jgi:hypothetical protein
VNVGIEIGKRTLVQLQRYRFRLMRFQEDFLKTFQLLDRPTDCRILLSNVELGNLGSDPIAGIGNIETYGHIARTVPLAG